jgi:Xaa-Pro aminopeptidase
MFKKRREAYLKSVSESSISLFFAGTAPQKSGDQSYPFVVNKNFFYLTGIDQEASILMMIKGQNQTKSYLFTEKRDTQKVLWDGDVLSFEQCAKISDLDLFEIMDLKVLKSFIAGLLSSSRRAIYGPIENFYFDLDRQNELVKKTDAEYFAHELKELYPFIQIKTSQFILSKLRMVKDDEEVKKIEEAIQITQQGLNQILSTLKPNMYEYEVEAEFNYVLNKHKTTPAFDTIAASGHHATILHYTQNDHKIENGNLVLFDLGVCKNNYNSDITRVYPANGKFTKRQKDIYEAVLKVNKASIAWLKAGITLKEFNDYGKEILVQEALKLGIISEASEISKYYYHGLGHYLGLDVHDVGIYSEPIPVGAIITVEPGLYIQEENIGVRIEDDVLVTEEGTINLSKDIEKEVHEIEALMKKTK